MPVLEPVPEKPALVVDDALVVTDLHIGKEEELRERGFALPSQTRRMGEEVAALLEAHRPRRLVILGDLKHQVPRFTGLERRDVPRFFDLLEGLVPEVHLVPGNHDGGIRYLLPRGVALHGPEGFRLGDVGFVHGHAWPAPEVMAAQVLLLGHNHPAVVFPDRLGFRAMERCWVRAGFVGRDARYEALPREAVVLPAFNELSGGTTMNETGTRYLGPLMTSSLLDLQGAGIYLLNGTFLGHLRDLMVEGRGERVEE